VEVAASDSAAEAVAMTAAAAADVARRIQVTKRQSVVLADTIVLFKRLGTLRCHQPGALGRCRCGFDGALVISGV
jgi:hypothetical protein